MATNDIDVYFGDREDILLLDVCAFKVVMEGDQIAFNNKKNDIGEVLLSKGGLYATVCEEIEFKTKDKKTGEPVVVSWFVQIGDDETNIPLSDVSEIIGEKITTHGDHIKFVIPKEWGQKSVKLIAELVENNKKKVTGDIYIRDHIVAAFFRIDTLKQNLFSINNVSIAKGTYNFLTEWETQQQKRGELKVAPPVHHHQGLFRVENTFYISGSTMRGREDDSNPSYVYKITGDAKANFDCENPIYFDKGVLPLYRHPGGIQVAKDIMAVGFEEYNPVLLGTVGRKNLSVICFFDIEGNEIENTRIVCDDEYWTEKQEIFTSGMKKKDADLWLEYEDDRIALKKEKGDIASATALLYDAEQDRYIVAVRGHNNAIRFYELKVVKNEEGDLKGTSVKRIGKEFNEVGDFQNVHLLYDDRGDIYMFGMEQCPKELCYIYRIDIDNPSSMINAVWIEDDGKIHEGSYSSTKKNKLEFELDHNANQPSFHWASCVFIAQNDSEHTPMPPEMRFDNKQKEENNINFNLDEIDEGFKGKILVYAIGAIVQDCFDHGRAWMDYENQYKRKDRRPSIVFIDKQGKMTGEHYSEPSDRGFELYLEQNYFRYLKNPHIDACYFKEG